MNKKKLAKEAAIGTGSAVARIIGLALKIVLTVVLIAICTGFLFVLIFSAYVKNTMKEDLTVTLDEFSLNQTSTIYYFNKDSQQWEVLERLAGLKGGGDELAGDAAAADELDDDIDGRVGDDLEGVGRHD